MTWLSDLLFNPSGFSHGMVVYSFVIALGLTLGRIKIFGVSLGSTWVLFLGLILSWLGLQVNPDLIAFFKNFGLILFVFFIGLQVGPSFFRHLPKRRLGSQRAHAFRRPPQSRDHDRALLYF